MVWDAALEPESRLVFVADYLTGQLLLWDQGASEEKALWEYSEYPSSVALSPFLDSFASGYRSAGLADQPIIAIWNTRSKEPAVTVSGTGTVHALAFSSDGARLAAAHGGVSLYNPSTGDRIAQLEFDPAFRPAIAVAFSPDGALIAAGHYDGSVTTWDSQSLTLLADQQAFPDSPPADRPLYSVAFSPDGRLLASGSPEATEVALLGPLASGTPTLIDVGHPVYSLAFSPDGHMLAAGGDSEITVWHTQDRTLACHLVTDATSIIGLAFTPDTTSLISASMESTFSEWQLMDECGEATE